MNQETLSHNKIAFITCVNNPDYYNECCYYIHHLTVPEGMEIEMIPVYHAQSMASGYNTGMNRTDAKYKVYLHQDVFLLYPDFLIDCINLFRSDDSIGMIGVLGSTETVPDAMYWNHWNAGKTYASDFNSVIEMNLSDCSEQYSVVQAIDGMIMMTQTDLPWREDLFRDFDFYDISQSVEFQKHSLKVVIPRMDSCWCLHDCGASAFKNYEKNREIFCTAYPESGYSFVPDEQISSISALEKMMPPLIENIDRLIMLQKWDDITAIIREIPADLPRTTDLIILKNLTEIYQAEKARDICNPSFQNKACTYKELREKYDRTKFLIRRLGFCLGNPDAIYDILRKNHISWEAVRVISGHSLFRPDVHLTQDQRSKSFQNHLNLMEKNKDYRIRTMKEVMETVDHGLQTGDYTDLPGLTKVLSAPQGQNILIPSRETRMLYLILTSLQQELKHGKIPFLSNVKNCGQLFEQYLYTVFSLRRLELSFSEEAVAEAEHYLTSIPFNIYIGYIIIDNELFENYPRLYRNVYSCMKNTWAIPDKIAWLTEFPGRDTSPDILLELAYLYMEIHAYRNACQCLEKISSPTAEITSLINTLKELTTDERS